MTSKGTLLKSKLMFGKTDVISLEARLPTLMKSIRLREGVFMYLGSVLGSGILVAPAIAANLAGPASLVAWVLVSFLSYPIGYTFGKLAASYPDAGGVSAFVKRGFGWSIGTVAGWLFVTSFFVGAPVVALVASSYILIALGLSPWLVYPVAFAFLSVTILTNTLGIRIGSRTESVILGTVLVLLSAAVIMTLPHVQLSNFTPFAPKGLYPVGTVAVVIFWSFQGYENVPHMAEEFRNPDRDFQLCIILSAAVTGLLYVLTSFATIGTGIYLNESLYAPVAIMFSRSLGVSSVVIVLFLAITTCYGTLNAYSIGVSRLVYALARDKSLPSALFKLNRHAAPSRAILVLFGGSAISLIIDALVNARLDQLFLLSGAGFITLYILGSAAAAKLLRGRSKGLENAFPYISLVASLIVFIFVREYVLFPVVVTMLSFFWIWMKKQEVNNGSSSENDPSLAR
ncbi:MAG TPA: amino acid permease [Terriglobales bacterium]|nr:amino acid permease [Terriglobales bacterium]